MMSTKAAVVADRKAPHRQPVRRFRWNPVYEGAGTTYGLLWSSREVSVGTAEYVCVSDGALLVKSVIKMDSAWWEILSS